LFVGIFSVKKHRKISAL